MRDTLQAREGGDYLPAIEFQLLFGNLSDSMTTPSGRVLAEERYQ